MRLCVNKVNMEHGLQAAPEAPISKRVTSGDCYRCKVGALLYSVFSKRAGRVVGVCMRCRNFIKELKQTTR
jgi:hypothetical protein